MAASEKGSLAVGTHNSALHDAHLFRENSASYLPEPVLSALFGGKAGKQEWERFFVGGCDFAKRERERWEERYIRCSIELFFISVNEEKKDFLLTQITTVNSLPSYSHRALCQPDGMNMTCDYRACILIRTSVGI